MNIYLRHGKKQVRNCKEYENIDNYNDFTMIRYGLKLIEY